MAGAENRKAGHGHRHHQRASLRWARDHRWDSTVLIDDGIIRRVGGEVPADATVVDAGGGTLLPGLIDSHCHTGMGSLRLALRFGVTTELDMMGYWPARAARVVARAG